MKIYCDGSYRPDIPGKPCFSAWSAWQDDQEIARWSARVEAQDSTMAELITIMNALVWASINKYRMVQVFTDNQTVQQQLIGELFSEKTKKICERILILKYQYFDELTFVWIPREQNELADSLCNEAVDNFLKKQCGKI